MERVIKRYLMHNQGDSEDPKQNEFDELKQDVQTIKFEILNDMKKSRDDNMRNMFILNGGIQFIAEELLNTLHDDNELNSSRNSLIDSDREQQPSFVRFKELINAHHNFYRSSSSMSLLDHHSNSSSNVPMIDHHPDDIDEDGNPVYKDTTAINTVLNSTSSLNKDVIYNNSSEMMSGRKKTGLHNSVDFINNLGNQDMKDQSPPMKSPSKVTFDLMETKVFHTGLQRILEENSEQKSSTQYL